MVRRNGRFKRYVLSWTLNLILIDYICNTVVAVSTADDFSCTDVEDRALPNGLKIQSLSLSPASKPLAQVGLATIPVSVASVEPIQPKFGEGQAWEIAHTAKLLIGWWKVLFGSLGRRTEW